MVFKRILVSISILALAAFAIGCNQAETSDNANLAATTSTRPGPDNSEITTTIDANGVKTETRTFRDNSRVSKVVVTTRNGQRTARVYSRSGEDKEINDVGDALEATGDELADGAGWVADKAEDVGQETADKAEDVGQETAGAAKKVGEKTVEGVKKVGEGAKKTGKAIKDAVTP